MVECEKTKCELVGERTELELEGAMGAARCAERGSAQCAMVE